LLIYLLIGIAARVASALYLAYNYQPIPLMAAYTPGFLYLGSS
jgi:hypothetical protein